MVIDTNNNGIKPGTAGTNASRTSSVAPRQDAKASPEPATNSREDVVLSQEAQSLGRLEDKINSLPDVNSERVEQIRQAITDGRFEINAQRIAENMLSQEDLLS